MFKHYCFPVVLFSFFLSIFSSPLHAAVDTKRMAAVLDLSARNGEGSNSTFGIQQSLDIMGIPYITTTNVTTAATYGIIYTNSYIGSSTLRSSERTAIINFVSGGGVLVSTNVNDSMLYPVFGLSGSLRFNTRHVMTWKVNSLDPSLRYFDDPREISISLGKQSIANVIYTRGYIRNGSASLATFDDGSDAVTKNTYGLGKAYSIGLSYTDIIVRNLLNKDYNAQRSFTNDFEPTTDTIMLFLRGIYEDNIDFPVWKHTAPGGSRAAFIITHDADSQSSMDMMGSFADLESGRGISATYNITTRYIDDALSGDFYSGNIPEMIYLLNSGHVISSHSVGHFPDFGKKTTVPEGAPGNTRENYQPYNNGTATTGATVYGELEVSKDLLETDTGATIKSFRSGHLAFNDKQINVLDALGYKYDSSFSANDVLTNFPYLLKYDRSLSGGVSNIYEIPLIISDSKITADNYPEKVATWLDVTQRNARNFAPTVLLIHPNRDYKLWAEEDLLDALPAGLKYMDMDSFGDYWRDRDSFEFATSLSGNILSITIPDTVTFPINEHISLYILNGSNLTAINMITEGGETVQFIAEQMGSSDDVVLRGLSIPTALSRESGMTRKTMLRKNKIR